MDHQSIDYARRFDSMERLYGSGALAALTKAHVVVAGIGGVGSWAAEALARSGIGRLTLIDLDNISEGNINRQIHALSTTIGASKVAVMQERIYEINPLCQVTIVEDFLTQDNLMEYLETLTTESWIIDAMDDVRVKAAVIAFAKRYNYPIIVSGAAGAKTDPQALLLSDLNFTYHDALCARLKSLLKKTYGFPTKPKKMGVPVVFSKENSNGPKHNKGGLNCAGYGSVVTITATMGLMMAGYVLNKLIERKNP